MGKRVFVPNKGAHDFSGALEFGELVFITEGYINKFALDSFYRTCIEKMKGATSEDYLLITSLNALCAVAAMILARKFGTVRFLLYRSRRHEYVERSIDVDALIHLLDE